MKRLFKRIRSFFFVHKRSDKASLYRRIAANNIDVKKNESVEKDRRFSPLFARGAVIAVCAILAFMVPAGIAFIIGQTASTHIDGDVSSGADSGIYLSSEPIESITSIQSDPIITISSSEGEQTSIDLGGSKLSLSSYALYSKIGYGADEDDDETVLRLGNERENVDAKLLKDDGSAVSIKLSLYSYDDVGDAIFLSFLSREQNEVHVGEFKHVENESLDFFLSKKTGYLYHLGQDAELRRYLPSESKISAAYHNQNWLYLSKSADGKNAIIRLKEEANGLQVYEEKRLSNLYSGSLYYDIYGNLFLGQGRVYSKNGKLVILQSNDAVLGLDGRLYWKVLGSNGRGYGRMEEGEAVYYYDGIWADRIYHDDSSNFKVANYSDCFRLSDSSLIYAPGLGSSQGKDYSGRFYNIDLSQDTYTSSRLSMRIGRYLGKEENKIYFLYQEAVRAYDFETMTEVSNMPLSDLGLDEVDGFVKSIGAIALRGSKSGVRKTLLWDESDNTFEIKELSDLYFLTSMLPTHMD